MLNIILKFFSVSVILTFFFSIVNTSDNIAFAHTIFSDNFESDIEGAFPSRWISTDEPGRTKCSAPWKVENKMLKISIQNQGSCTTNIVPKTSEWDTLLDNYIYELDAYFIAGTDHNIVFRYNPLYPSWFFELHFQSPGDFVLSAFPGSFYKTNIPGNYPNRGEPYHIKVIVNNNNVKVYVDYVLVRDVVMSDQIPPGRIAVRAGTGGDPNSTTWFDNIVVRSIEENILDVPYFSQNYDEILSPWGDDEYDHAISLGFDDINMDRWGCAVASLAMILNYHNIINFGSEFDDKPINPGTLNEWLKKYDQDAVASGRKERAFVTGHNSKNEPYSSIVWGIIGTLTKRLYSINKAQYELDPHPFSKHSVIDENIEIKDREGFMVAAPPVVKVTKAGKTIGHYVVMT